MKVIAVGNRAFVSGFRLAGVSGIEVEHASQALAEITRLTGEKGVGIVIVADAIARPIRDKLNELRAKHAVPLIYEIPSPGGKREKMEYREMLRQILGV